MNSFTTFNRALVLVIKRGQSTLPLHETLKNVAVAPDSLPRHLPSRVAEYVRAKAEICQPEQIYVCDGSEAENTQIMRRMEQGGLAKRLRKHENCWLVRTDPADVARVESKTVMATRRREDTLPPTAVGVKCQLGNWMSVPDMERALNSRFQGSMKGRTMYVIPFSMGPVGSPLSKIGVEITDSPYVVASMRIMTRMGADVLEWLGSNNEDFVGCMHSVGRPLPVQGDLVNNWPCNPEKTLIAHLPERNEICSYGSGYGGNSLLGKKCLALRLGSILARREGWLAEHMLIIGITTPSNRKHYIAAAFPSACGKTNLAMLIPTLPGYKVECVGDDIAWMRFDKEGRLRAINPEAGFFGVAPGTNSITNRLAMDTIQRNTIFTNTAETSEGGFYWEGMEKEINENVDVIDWRGRQWKRGSNEIAAHPNSRFCVSANQCPIMDPNWESAEGVPISAILFGGRRPNGVPLVFEAFDWEHGVFLGASMRSEATAAAEHKGKTVMHDPFAMRPFFGYNFGHYLSHWLNVPQLHPDPKLPKIFHVNWFRKDDQSRYLWPGFGENCRVLDWIIRRIESDPSSTIAHRSPIGYIPKEESFQLDGMKESVDWQQLFSVPKQFWTDECAALEKYFQEQVGNDLPGQITKQLHALRDRLGSV